MINKLYILSKKNITRFPPDPNGFLHIGHSFSIFLNYYLSFFKKGNFLIRFDNTNFFSNKIKYYNFILYDLIWLGIKWNKIKYFLNDIKIYLKILFFFFKNKKIYFKKKIFFFRIYFNYLNYLKIFYLIIINFFKKKDFSNFFKKKIIYRKNNNKKFIFTYDFSQCFNDFINNIKISICTNEFKKNSKIYNTLLKKIKNKSLQFEFEKKKIKNIIISKKKLNKYYFNLFYFRKIKISQKNINYLCNFIGISEKKNYIKKNFFINSILIEKNFIFFEMKKYKFKKIINIKKYFLLNILNNKKNLNLNFNVFKLKIIIKNNVSYLNFLLINNFFFFLKKIKFNNYKKKFKLLLFLKIIKKIKIINYNKKKHCLYENKLFYNKNNLLN